MEFYAYLLNLSKVLKLNFKDICVQKNKIILHKYFDRNTACVLLSIFSRI